MCLEPRFAISRRWIECVNLLIANGYTSNYKTFCASISIKPQSLNDIKSERRSVTLDIIHDTCNAYQVSLSYLLLGSGPPLTVVTPVDSTAAKQVDAEVKASFVAEQPLPRFISSTRGNASFPLITYEEAANYLANYQHEDYHRSLQAVTLPPLLVSSSPGILLQLQGDSMMPVFQPGDWVAGTLLAPAEWAQIRDFDCFIVVSKSLGIQFRRVENRLAAQGILRCQADNRHYPESDLRSEELLQLFRFAFHISSGTGWLESRLFQKVAQLEETTTDLRTVVQQLEARLALLGELPAA